MNMQGWIFMIVSVSVVTVFSGYCVMKVLTAVDNE
jgi:hypothetical protein